MGLKHCFSPFKDSQIQNLNEKSLKLARFASLRCATGGHFMSAGCALWAPGITWINYKGDNISQHFCPTVLIDIARKITKFVS